MASVIFINIFNNEKKRKEKKQCIYNISYMENKEVYFDIDKCTYQISEKLFDRYFSELQTFFKYYSSYSIHILSQIDD